MKKIIGFAGLLIAFVLSFAPHALAETLLKTGEFESGEYKTRGEVKIIKADNGKYYVEMSSKFKTDKGPDLFVTLHRSRDVIKSDGGLVKGEYMMVSPLLKTSGSQYYLLPDYINPDNYQSVVIWSRELNETFGAANLDDSK